MTFSVGSLVKTRGREWVILPESTEDLLVLRPLGGTDDEIAGVYLPLERVEPAQFDLPDPAQVGDYRSARLLRDAVRLGFRSSAGPFRSFARLAFEPRPYQLVPLLMALKLDPVRMLIADDVGIGKTVEAGLVARELLDRGEIERLAVLCPPQLAEQWQAELRDKFHMEAELVLPGTVARLERGKALNQSLFELYPFTVVSTDYIKAERRRAEFLRTCPEFVIVDEAHTCAFAEGTRGARHQRYELLQGLAKNADRHLILVTATPHSGKEDAFRSLLALLTADFTDLPADLSGKENEKHRRRLAMHFIQRRRADIRHYLAADTPFPEREEREDTYSLSPDYKRLFARVLEYAREAIAIPDPSQNKFRQRVRWWSALALLRALASSPAAAAATLRTRAAAASAETPEGADEIGRRTVLDLAEADSAEGVDVAPGGDAEDGEVDSPTRRRLLDMARQAEALQGEQDAKLQRAVKLVKELLDDGFRPIVFCRFIPTAEYLAARLREAFKKVEVVAVTGLLAPAEREARVTQLAEAGKRVLVCTDCLSEGINLQEHFDAVMHYDLSWNPTRHEQREGRVDRYGQGQSVVRMLTYYGTDNQIDGLVLDVLLRKHQAIRNSLGISVPVPLDADKVVEALLEGLLLKGGDAADFQAQYLPGLEAFIKPHKEELFSLWEAAQDREKRSRTLFAQETLKPEAVAAELQAAQAAVGAGTDVAAFVTDAFRANGATVSAQAGVLKVDFQEAPRALREALSQTLEGSVKLEARFELPLRDGQVWLSRTHPVVAGLAGHLFEAALDPVVNEATPGSTPARRCGAIRTRAVQRRTTLLLLRARYHLVTPQTGGEQALLAEDCLLAAFAGAPDKAEWLDPPAAEALLQAMPDANVLPEQASDFARKVIQAFDHLRPHLDDLVRRRGQDLLAAHLRVREAARLKRARCRVEPQMPADVLGVYVYLPAAK